MSSLIEEWNSALPFQLTTAALQHPNEEFLLGAIKCLLQEMGINVAQMAKDSYEVDEQQHGFRIDLVQYVNHLLKISTNKDNFQYYDLVCPTPKKTVYVLKMLLNYYFFYHTTVFGQVLGVANEAIQAYEAAQQELNQRQRQKMKQRDQLDAIQMRDDDVEATHIPAVQRQIAEGRRQQQRLAEQQQQLTEAQLQRLELEHRVQERRDQLVPEEERERLCSELEALDAECRQLDEEEQQAMAANREMASQIEQLTANTALCEAIEQTCGLEQMLKKQTLLDQIAAAQQELHTVTEARTTLIADIADKRRANERDEKLVAAVAGKQTKAARANAKQMAALRCDQKEALARLNRLAEETAGAQEQLDAECATHEFLEANLQRLLSLIVEQ